jgi:hypothetical protein
VEEADRLWRWVEEAFGVQAGDGQRWAVAGRRWVGCGCGWWAAVGSDSVGWAVVGGGSTGI